MQQALASGKGFDLASQYKTMMDLANQAVAAGNTALADKMRAGAAAIASAGVGAGQGIYDSLIAALQAAAAQGDVTAALLIQDLQRVQAQAAATKAENDSYTQSLAALQMQEAAATATLQQYKEAVAGAQAELTGLKEAETGAKQALDAASASVTAAKAQVQGLQQQYQAAQQALSDFKGAQLEGEGAASEAQIANTQRQKEIQLANPEYEDGRGLRQQSPAQGVAGAVGTDPPGRRTDAPAGRSDVRSAASCPGTDRQGSTRTDV
jgi:hypothetical protein